MRTFEACGFKNIIMIDTKIDIYNPNTIRSSLGAVFQLNVFKMNSEDIFHFLSIKLKCTTAIKEPIIGATI